MATFQSNILSWPQVGADFHTTVNVVGVAATSILNLAAELGHGGVLKVLLHSRARADGGVASCLTALPWVIHGDQPHTVTETTINRQFESKTSEQQTIILGQPGKTCTTRRVGGGL